MLHAHADQENLVASHHAAAAAKPLNAGAKGLGPSKAPKTPFKLPLNDENGRTGLKTQAKGTENQLQPTGKKLDSNAFVTPAGPRTRAPLGMKTTNAKAAAFATPAPQTEPPSEKTGVKSSGPRLRRPKVKVHQPSPAVDVTRDGEHDVEYMPPREIPLPDDPSDWPSDMQYPQFAGENLVRGTYQTYYDPVDDDGIHLSDKRIAEHKAKVDARHEAMLQRSLEETLGPLTDKERDVLGFAPAPTPAAVRPATATGTSRSTTSTRRPLSATATSRPAPLTSRNAASALSNATNSTASVHAHARSRSALPNSAVTQPRRKPSTATLPNPSNSTDMRHQAATAASRTTLGYGKGRSVSTSLRKPLSMSSGNHQRPASQMSNPRSRTASTAPTRHTVPARPRSTWARRDPDATSSSSRTDFQVQDENEDPEMDMIRQMALRNLRLDDGPDGDDWFSRAQSGALGAEIDDDEDDGFQFTIPEF